MGFWSGLGKVLKGAVGFIPGVGPALSAGMDMFGSDATGAAQAYDPWLQGSSPGGFWSDMLKKAGGTGNVLRAGADMAGAAAQGREAGRDKENVFNQNSDALRLRGMEGYENALQNRSGIDLAQRKFGLESQNNAFRNALLSAYGKNVQDVTLGGTPKNIPITSFGGGLRPSAMGPEGRAAADLMNKKAMASLMNGETFDKLPEIEKFSPTEMKKGNVLDTILGTVGSAGKAYERIRADQTQQEQQGTLKQLLLEAQKQGMQPQAPPQAPVGPGSGFVQPRDPMTGLPIKTDPRILF